MVKLTIKKPERRQQCRSGVFIANFEHVSLLVLLFFVNFNHLNAGWAVLR